MWLDVRQPTLVELLVRIGRAYGDADICNASNPLSKVNEVAVLLRETQPLLILDGAIDESVLAELYGRCCQDISLVVTNDRALGGGDWRNQGIGNLDAEDAVLLFKQKAGIADDETDEAIDAIVGRLNGEPFPVVVAARSMIVAQQSPAEFDASLEELLDEADGIGGIAALNAGFPRAQPPFARPAGHVGRHRARASLQRIPKPAGGHAKFGHRQIDDRAVASFSGRWLPAL